MAAQSSSSQTPQLQLQASERLIRSGRAMKRILLSSTIGQSIFMGLTVGSLVAFLSLKHDHLTSWIFLSTVVGVAFFFPVLLSVARLRWGWHRWWLTDQRLVVRHGLFGYELKSVPLDRVVDVTLRTSWWDQIWGLRHIQVRDMTGEISSNQLSVGLKLIAVQDAAQVAEDILHACPSVSGEKSEMGEVIELLQAMLEKAS